MKAMETLQDLIEEAKVRTVWWALCIFTICYFLSHTSKSMWMNVPVTILLVSALRILSDKVEFRWKVQSVRRQTYLSHLEKKQLPLNDPRLSTSTPAPKWKRKIGSPVVEAAMNDFINKVLQDFVVDLWYSEITADKEAPEQMRALIMDVLGEISGRVKEINLVDLLTRDIVDLIGDHIDLFRRNQAAIGVDVMGTLSSEERDERLKHHLIVSRDLHPALTSPECEYKVLQRLVGGILAVVLRPREAQCPLVRCIARELVTSLVLQPLMDFASPGYINELIEYILLFIKDGESKESGDSQSADSVSHHRDHPIAAGGMHNDNGESSSRNYASSYNQRPTPSEASESSGKFQEEPLLQRSADWARVFEAATQRRSEVLAPENLENMWTKGRNYKNKDHKNVKPGIPSPLAKDSGTTGVPKKISRKEMRETEDKVILRIAPALSLDTQLNERNFAGTPSLEGGGYLAGGLDDATIPAPSGNKGALKRSNSTSALKALPGVKSSTGEGKGAIISEFYSPDSHRHEDKNIKSPSDMALQNQGLLFPKIKCRVIGAYFEKIGSKSFAVYSIAVTDAERKTWFVKRRYRNFERLHRHLKEIPNYTLHLPPKRIFSSSTEDSFVHQRCIQLDRYLQDLLSIANVAEQHEVWDFLSVSSKNYSFGKSSSVMRTLAVNVDEAVDDIVRQFKGVSDGLLRKVSGPSSSAYETSPSTSVRNLSWLEDDVDKVGSRHSTVDTANSSSDHEEGGREGSPSHEEVGSSSQAKGWHSDTELNSKGFPPRVIKHGEEVRILDSEKRHGSGVKSEESFPVGSGHLGDSPTVPPEWSPPNVSVPVLNLVDKIFQLKRRGWIRRQVFWISKQILQLVMEDAIDDWLLRQIHWLRNDDIIAQGIRWVQDILWPDGAFFIKIGSAQSRTDDTKFYPDVFQTSASKASAPSSFELQLEAARRASDVKKMIFSGAPTTLVSLIGSNQYKRCAKDIYYFLQSSVCIKQLAYGILELLLISIFPELRDLVLDIHEKTRV